MAGLPYYSPGEFNPDESDEQIMANASHMGTAAGVGSSGGRPQAEVQMIAVRIDQPHTHAVAGDEDEEPAYKHHPASPSQARGSSPLAASSSSSSPPSSPSAAGKDVFTVVPGKLDELAPAEAAELLMTCYMDYTLQESIHMPLNERAKAKHSVKSKSNEEAREYAEMQQHKQQRHRLSSDVKRGAAAAASLGTDNGAGAPPTTHPHYHARQFTMAYVYWLKENDAAAALAAKEEKKNAKLREKGELPPADDLAQPAAPKAPPRPTATDLQSYLQTHAKDWMPSMTEFLSTRGSLAWMWAFNIYFFTAVLLPVNVMWLSANTDFGRTVRHVYSTYVWSLFHIAVPASDLMAYTRWQRLQRALLLGTFYLCLVIPIPLRYWALYSPFGGDATSRIDVWFPPALAALSNVCVAGHAVVALTFNKDKHPALVQAEKEEKEKQAQADREEKERQARVALEKMDEKERNKLHSKKPSTLRNFSTLGKSLFGDEKAKKPPTAASLFSEPSASELRQAEMQCLLDTLVVPDARASPDLFAVPSDTLRALCLGLKQNDFRWSALSSKLFIGIGLALSLVANVVSVRSGGYFWGDCEARRPTDRECPFPVELMHLAVIIRLVIMAVCSYFFMFVLHQSAVYFENKSLVRKRLLILLNKLLKSKDVRDLVEAQNMQFAAQRFSEQSASSPAARIAVMDAQAHPGDVSRLPTDLSIWWAAYRFMDEFDEREGAVVQVTLAWYGAFVVFCCAIVLTATLNKWSGVDLLVLFILCASIALLIGTYVLLILVNGIQINELPTCMHQAMRDAEMRMQLALSIVQKDGNEAPQTHPGASGGAHGGAISSSSAAHVLSASALTSHCSLSVAASLLRHFASSFEFRVLSSPFTVLFVPLTKTLVITGGTAALTAAVSVVAAAVTGAVKT